MKLTDCTRNIGRCDVLVSSSSPCVVLLGSRQDWTDDIVLVVGPALGDRGVEGVSLLDHGSRKRLLLLLLVLLLNDGLALALALVPLVLAVAV